MNKLFAALLILCALSCNTKNYVSATITNNDLGVDWTFSERVNESYMNAVDSMINLSLQQFNAEKHSIKLHKKKAADKEYVTFHFTNGRKVSPAQKRNGYILSAVGLVAIPATMAALDMGFVIGFYYWPQNTLDAKVSLSPAMTDSIYSYRKIRVQTGALFKPSNVQTEKLFKKFQSRFMQMLIQIDQRFSKQKIKGYV